MSGNQLNAWQEGKGEGGVEGGGGEGWDEEAIYTRPSCREYDEAVSARS